jgi:pheromone shutdown-related protein TraB
MNYISPDIDEVENNVHKISFSTGKTVYLIGTAHVSENSAQLVEDKIKEIKPDTVCIELDEQRFLSITQKKRYEDLDIFEIIKKKQLFFFIGQFVLSSFQKKISEKTGSRPGEEFIRAINLAEDHGYKLQLIDRNIGITLKRAWRLTPFKDKFKFFGSLLFTESGEFDNLNIEDLKKKDAIEALVESFSKELPETKKVLIDERDLYLTHGIQNKSGKITIAVVGAGHVPGILKNIQTSVSDELKNQIDFIPSKSIAGKIIPWTIPLIIMIFFAAGFFFGKENVAKEFIFVWIMANGILTVIGSILALAHPITIAVAFVAAPITSLNPTIGAGMVTALVQAMLVKPRVKDFEQLNGNTLKIRDWWSNRLTKIFLVFVLSSIGSSIGTFVAMPALLKFFW